MKLSYATLYCSFSTALAGPTVNTTDAIKVGPTVDPGIESDFALTIQSPCVDLHMV